MVCKSYFQHHVSTQRGWKVDPSNPGVHDRRKRRWATIASYRNILADYKTADFNERLHIYMQFPHLRSELIDIDRQEVNGDLFNAANGRRITRVHRDGGSR